MAWSRRAFIGATAASVTGLSLIPGLIPARANAQANRQKTYGVVEIRRGGMSVAAYRFDRDQLGRRKLSGFERMAPEPTGKAFVETELASPLGPAADDAMAAQSVDIVAGHIDRLKSQHGLQTSDIAVLVSGGLIDFAPGRVEQFIAALPARTGITPEIISIKDQARLGYDWIVRPADRRNVMHVNIASGTIKGGYYDQHGQFVALSAPYGAKTMAGAVKLRWPDVRTATVGQRASEFYGDTVAPVLAPQIATEPPPQQRPTVYLTGGIVTATAVIFRPKAILQPHHWVEMQPDDFANLLGLIASGTPYGGPLPATLTGEEGDRVRDALHRVRNSFNPHEMAAGAAIGDGLARQLRFDQRIRLALPQLAGTQIWVSQYLLEKFG
ncbi:hypothetical protein BV87_10430 [Sphingobium yanoikuyae]|jgi:hypothetical protein|uniref:Uncharacterized protein n=3 Tax=Sphingomonadaceae TaxID=41297 RepID=A0A0J9CUF6_SPHYA|nr:hypothetical protein BV87_10430 [Sphingobium yanoikuyae]KMW28419.1 hypothetical protein BV87_21780 [Sphingobium yanoikuyae]TKV43657.1 hypothetical protein A0U87_12470 [Sphingobium sp. MP9-4]